MTYRSHDDPMDQARDEAIRNDLFGSSVEDLVWLASKVNFRLYRDLPEVEQAEWQRMGRMYEVERENGERFLALLTKIIEAKAQLEAAQIQADTNEALVNQTKHLVRWTMWLAGATIVLAVIAVAALLWDAF